MGMIKDGDGGGGAVRWPYGVQTDADHRKPQSTNLFLITGFVLVSIKK